MSVELDRDERHQVHASLAAGVATETLPGRQTREDASRPSGETTLSLATEVVLFHDLTQSIVSALEARDPHTAEHSLRVGDMTERTCLLMGLTHEQLTPIHMAAHVHDIGKIGIPDAVLLKKGCLTPEEHELLRDHARIGAQIIGSCPSLSAIAELVLHHHERWDGTGYPDGLAGTDIPLGSRIIAVCDSIDAMLGKRLTKKSLTQAECREEIRANADVMYDPDIAAFVLDHWDQIVGPVNFRDSADFEALDPTPGRLLRCEVPYAQNGRDPVVVA